jgi:hypothetical protein
MLWGYLAVGACWPVSVYAVTIGALATGVVHRALEPAHVSVWINERR